MCGNLSILLASGKSNALNPEPQSCRVGCACWRCHGHALVGAAHIIRSLRHNPRNRFVRFLEHNRFSRAKRLNRQNPCADENRTIRQSGSTSATPLLSTSCEHRSGCNGCSVCAAGMDSAYINASVNERVVRPEKPQRARLGKGTRRLWPGASLFPHSLCSRELRRPRRFGPRLRTERERVLECVAWQTNFGTMRPA